MGLERAATVLQGVHSVFDTDLFRTLIAATESEIGKHAEGDDAGSFRVIADHLRSTLPSSSPTGVTPSNEGARFMCCAGSCAAPCAMPICSARPSR